ncbi:MAG: DUF1858 domain-containing protein [Anaerolineae bacterium]|nr:DUF1858 domain-containing protein [Anaerolineae bacterium]
MTDYSFTPETSVNDLVQKWPQVIPVFIQFHMACVGCSMSAFETLEDAANIYAIDPQLFMQRLEEAIRESSPAV